MTRRRLTGWLPAVALLLAVGGCAGKAPPVRYYTLAPPAAGAAPAGAGIDLLVGPFTIDPPYDQDRLIYRSAPGSAELGFYNYHRWASPLSRLLAVSLAAALEGTPGVGSTDPTVTRQEYDARLVGRVLWLEEVDTASGATARIAIEFRLLDGQGEELWTGVLESEASGPSAQGPEAMELVRRAFGDLTERLRERVAAALA